jgi:hypothetical protein
VPDDTLSGLKHLPKAGVAVASLLVMVGMFASVAYAATIHGTDNHDWGKARDDFADPPNCGARCGEMIHGVPAGTTSSTDTRAGTTLEPTVATTWYTVASGWK